MYSAHLAEIDPSPNGLKPPQIASPPSGAKVSSSILEFNALPDCVSVWSFAPICRYASYDQPSKTWPRSPSVAW